MNKIPSIERNLDSDLYWGKEESKLKIYENNRTRIEKKSRLMNGKIVKK